MSEKKKFTFVAFFFMFNAHNRKKIMAKGNLFLGMGRGKVGDVVFYRSNGEQITRARNRHPRNPNTDAQIIQRAVMAGVQRVYSLGYQLFNHAFQGYRVGAENQRRFVKVNADKIRKAVLAALNGSETPVYLGAPGILSPVPNEYIVSEGNYDQTLLSIDATTPANPKWVLPTAGSATTIGAYAAAHGLVDGDIYTIVGIFTKSDTMDYEYFDQDGQLVEDASVRKAHFAYLQLRVKAGTQASTAALSSSTQWDDIFDEAHGTTGSKTIAEGLDMVDVSGIDGSGAWAVIRSRENEDLRSTSTLQLFGNQSGVTPEWLFDVWSKEAANLASDLTLEGSDFSRAGGSALPTPVAGSLGAVHGLGSDYYLACELSNGQLALVSVNGEIPTGSVLGNSIQIDFSGQIGEVEQRPENVNALVTFNNTTGVNAAKSASGLSEVVVANLVPSRWEWDSEAGEAAWSALFGADSIELSTFSFDYDDTSFNVEDLNN